MNTTKEIEIVEAACAPLNIGAALADVLRKFDMGESLTRCTPREGTTDQDIGRGITVLAGVRNWTEFALGDLITELKKRGYKDVIPQIIAHLNLDEDYNTLAGYARTAANTPHDLRDLPNLRFTHFREACSARYSKDPKIQEDTYREVITEASNSALNVAQTRELSLNKRGKSTAPTPPPAPAKPRYITIEKNSMAIGGVIVTAHMTEPECDCDRICIDMEALQYSEECHGNQLHAWLPMTVEREEVKAQAVEDPQERVVLAVFERGEG